MKVTRDAPLTSYPSQLTVSHSPWADDCRGGCNQPGRLQSLNLPIPVEGCQHCFRWWLCKRTAGKATEDIAHRFMLFPSLSSLWHLPSVRWGWCYSKKTASILGQAARAWLSSLRLSIALGKENTGQTDMGLPSCLGNCSRQKLFWEAALVKLTWRDLSSLNACSHTQRWQQSWQQEGLP